MSNSNTFTVTQVVARLQTLVEQIEDFGFDVALTPKTKIVSRHQVGANKGELQRKYFASLRSIMEREGVSFDKAKEIYRQGKVRPSGKNRRRIAIVNYWREIAKIRRSRNCTRSEARRIYRENKEA